jgi:formylmethanofuran dehydrogenase subunit E
MTSMILASILAVVAQAPAAPSSAEAECLSRVKEIHGAAGAWAVAGYRMGDRALKDLGLPRHSFSLLVVHKAPAQVQYSCIADGLQAATGTSPGKLNLQVEEVPIEQLSTIVEDRKTGRRLTFMLRPEFIRSIKDLPHGRAMMEGKRIASLPDDEIFVVTESRTSKASSEAHADEVGSMMADAARRFVASLDEKQATRATFSFSSPERLNWHWIPRERKGLPIKELKRDQRALAFGLLGTGLSTKGMLKATTIMSLEEILFVEEHGTGPVRDPELYFVSIFGTLKGGRIVSATPFMFGSNPAEVRSGPRKGLRNLVEIEEPVNSLLASLSEEQRKAAIVNPTAPDVTTTPNPAQAPVTSPEGIPAEKLDAGQRQALTRLLHAYAANFPDPIRASLLDQLGRDPQSIHFAWYGPADPTKPHAFRVQGSAFFIDFNETQNDTNHIHTFYRSLLGDFGLPALP